MLAQAAKTSVPPLLHCVAEQLQEFVTQAGSRPSTKSSGQGGLEEVGGAALSGPFVTLM